jgi:hypothetical protein
MVAPGTASAAGGRRGEDAIPVSKFVSCRFLLKSKACMNKTLKPQKLLMFKFIKMYLKSKLTWWANEKVSGTKLNPSMGCRHCSSCIVGIVGIVAHAL